MYQENAANIMNIGTVNIVIMQTANGIKSSKYTYQMYVYQK